ncbi:uncharacterized protein LOC128201735 [Galleria mellonella]|uniref:Uncharacterized protein LOC128201735 n=1 Tax=Galleria mellonella TaxID=7137 RepID=A0ABM3MVY1_GALME|nr:uncharacterized protein LOC128201735 [Galleria mellonella]
MKYFILLVAVTQALLASGQPTNTIPAPHITILTARDDSLDVSWSKVENVISNEPVLGYVVKVWEIPPVTVYKYEVKDGEKVLVQEQKEPELDTTKIPSGVPREIKVPDATITTANIDGIKFNVLYHIRVLAYTKSQQGPLSDAAGIKLIDNDTKTS